MAKKRKVTPKRTGERVAAATGEQGPAVAVVAACPFPSHQGTQVFIRHLVNGLAASGMRLVLFTYDVSEPLHDVPLHPDVAWYRAPALGVGLRSGPSIARAKADAALLRMIRDVATRMPFDVIVAHNAEGLAVSTVASRMLGVPLVYHAHSALGLELPTYATTMLGRIVAKAAGTVFDTLTPRSADAVICFDEAQRQHHGRLGVPTERLHVIPPALDMDELGTDRAGGRFTVIYAGNPDGYQNLELLRSAFATLRQSEPWWRLRILSNHAPQAFGALATVPGVSVVSYSGPAQLGQLLRSGSVGISTRTLWVGAPVKVLTYLSAGLPVVACASGARLLEPFADAATLTEATPEALAEAIRRSHTLNPARARAAFDLATLLPRYRAIIEAQRATPAASRLAELRGRRAKAKATARPERGASPSPQ